MTDIIMNLVAGWRVEVQQRNLAALARMPAVGIFAAAELGMVHICRFRCDAVHCVPSSLVTGIPVLTSQTATAYASSLPRRLPR